MRTIRREDLNNLNRLEAAMSTILVLKKVQLKDGTSYEEEIFVSGITHHWEALRAAKRWPLLNPKQDVKKVVSKCYHYSLHDD
mgnify:CR=1 FL=1